MNRLEIFTAFVLPCIVVGLGWIGYFVHGAYMRSVDRTERRAP